MKTFTDIITLLVNMFMAWWKLKTSNVKIEVPDEIPEIDRNKLDEVFGGASEQSKSKAIELIKGL